MKNLIKPIALLAFVSAVFTACKKDDADPAKPSDSNPQELITTVILTGYDQNAPNNTNRQFTYKWEDIDGAGGNAPVIDSLLLDSGITYKVNVLLLDKTKNPIDTVSLEVAKEADEHQFFYTPNSALGTALTIERLDVDGNTPPLPVGLEVRLSSNQRKSGLLNVKLSHYDGVPKTTSPSSESDVDIDFPVRIR